MHQSPSIIQRIKSALRIDRSFHLVWMASRRWTILSICLTVIQGIFPLLALYIIKLIVDTVSLAVQTGDAAEGFQRIVYLVAAAALVAVVQAGMRLAGGYVAEAQAAVVTDYVSTTLHEKSISLDLAYYENPRYYDTLHRAQREGPYRPTKIVNGFTRILQNSVSLFTMVGLLFMLHWSIGFFLIISTIPGIVVQLFFARKTYAWQKKRTHDERKSSYLSTILTADAFAKEVRLFDLGKFFSNAFDTLRNILRKEKLSLTKKRNFADFLAQAIAAAILMGCLLFITLRALHGLITIGDMVMYYQAFQRGIGYLKDLLTSIASLYEDNMFVAYFFEFLDIKNRVTDPIEPSSMPTTFSQGIEFDNISFEYPGQRDAVLENFSLKVGAGEVVALVGANGAGKSTIVKLMCRLYDPQKGKIMVDGVDIKKYPLKELRNQISVVFQDYSKYFLTVAENIRLGDISLPEKSSKIQEAAIKANADGFINNLPKGYDTNLGKWFYSGEELSLGEWQKIVLARAFIRESNLIVLDEPTSSMDVNTEYHLFTKFRELTAGRSALLISHRFSTVRMADRIYVLEGGRIVEEGSHQELMALSGTYAEMYTKQAAWLDAPN